MIDLKNPKIMESSSNAIYDLLKDAAIKREFISTSEYTRGVGKTTALIRFAKEYGFGVVVKHGAKAFVIKHDYDKVYNQTEARGKGLLVFDEGVDRDFIYDNKDSIATGFIYE